MLVARITDTHITSSGKLALPRLPPKGGVVDTASGLERAVAALVRLRPLPDITVVTGDLVDAGEPAEYAYFRGLLAPLRMPVSQCLTYPWYETPNIHLCTIRDFVALCDELGVRVERSITLDRHGQPYSLNPRGGLANLLAEQGVFVLSSGRGGPGGA